MTSPRSISRVLYVFDHSSKFIHIYVAKLTLIQPVSHTDFDIDLLGDCDVVVSELSRRAGWDLQHHMIPADERVEISPVEGYESRHMFQVVGA